MKHKITIAQDVPFYGEIEVEAKTQNEAAFLVQSELCKPDPLSSPLLKNLELHPQFDLADGLRMVVVD
jgi:hypothetical protein